MLCWIIKKSFNSKLQGSQHCKNEIRGLIFHALKCVEVDKVPHLVMWKNRLDAGKEILHIVCVPVS